jgi:hypothetical protein
MPSNGRPLEEEEEDFYIEHLCSPTNLVPLISYLHSVNL